MESVHGSSDELGVGEENQGCKNIDTLSPYHVSHELESAAEDDYDSRYEPDLQRKHKL